MNPSEVIAARKNAGGNASQVLPPNLVVTKPNPIPYKPIPTDAVMITWGGFKPQPANPLFFSTWNDAVTMLAELAKNCEGLPSGVLIRDAPENLGPVIYGMDGRKVYCIEFSTMKEDVKYNFSVSVGQLMWMQFTYPDYKWKISYEESGIIRNPTTGHI